jgi:hypothetical protein
MLSGGGGRVTARPLPDPEYRARLAALAAPSAGRSWHWLTELVKNPALMAPPQAVASPICFAGRVTLLAGREKEGGKSTLAGHLVAEASRRGLRSFIVTLDEPEADTVQRQVRFDADTDFVAVDSQKPADLAANVRETGAALVVIDSLHKWAGWDGATVPDSGDSAGWSVVMQPFQAVARELNPAVVVIHHANKSDGGYRDSTAIGAAADLIVTIRTQRDGSRRAKVVGRFHVPDFTVTLDSDQRVLIDTDATADPEGGTEPVALSTQRQVLQILFETEPEGLKSNAWKGQAVESLGHAARTFHRARKALLEAGRVSYASRIYHVSPMGERFLAQQGN